MNEKELGELVCHQLSSYWIDFDREKVKRNISCALERIEENFKGSASPRLFSNGKVNISPFHTVTWAVFLYYLSNSIFVNEEGEEAGLVYYLNKVMHANDWYCEIKLPTHFFAEHPLGSVLGRADYGDYFFVYQGTTVGGNRKIGGVINYPRLGNNVLLYANSVVLGNTTIGNNVIIAADTYILNEHIPDNCIVFGKSPDIQFVLKDETTIKDMTSHIWKW